MANNFGGGYFSIMDYDKEIATFGFNTGAITAVSLPGTLTQFGALRTALQPMIEGVIAGEGLYVNRSKLSNVRPTNPSAQRERKWMVMFEDTTEFFDPPTNAIPNAGFRKVFSSEIGTAKVTNSDDSDRLIDGTDRLDLTQTDAAALVTALEALVKSPYGGAINVIDIFLVGRNL